MEFGIWTPVPHAVMPDPQLQAAIEQATTWPEREAPYEDLSFGFIRDIVCRADELGYDYTLIAERFLGPDLESWALTGALATLTRRIHLLTAVHPGIYTPQIVAKMGASLDRISNGRFHINLVSGWWRDEFEMFGGRWLEDEHERYVRELEFIQLIKAFWAQASAFDFDGRYYQVKDASLPLRPVQRPWPPIFAASRHDQGIELIAREGDWWFVSGISPDFREWQTNLERVRSSIEDMRERAARYGRTIRFGMSVYVICAPNDDEALVGAERLEAFGKLNRIASIPAKGLGAGLFGRAETIAERMSLYAEAGIEMFLMHFNPMREGLETFASEVMPLVGQREPVQA